MVIATPCCWASLFLIALLRLWAGPGSSHPQGLYATEAKAEQRSRELGCEASHRNSGQWMPCKNEADLHQELRNR